MRGEPSQACGGRHVHPDFRLLAQRSGLYPWGTHQIATPLGLVIRATMRRSSSAARPLRSDAMVGCHQFPVERVAGEIARHVGGPLDRIVVELAAAVVLAYLLQRLMIRSAPIAIVDQGAARNADQADSMVALVQGVGEGVAWPSTVARNNPAVNTIGLPNALDVSQQRVEVVAAIPG